MWGAKSALQFLGSGLSSVITRYANTEQRTANTPVPQMKKPRGAGLFCS
jgi:hypothetical protein